MRRLLNRVDHVAWIAHHESLEDHVGRLEALSGVSLERFERADAGIVICVNWAAGLEILSPLARRTAFNAALHDHLAQFGEGVFSVVFGVASMERHTQRLEALGYPVGPELDDHPDSPWHDRIVLRERVAGSFMGGHFVLGAIDYADGIVSVRDT